MGATASQPYAPTAGMFINGIPTETLDICLACEKDGYNDRTRNPSELKQHIRQFIMRSVRNVDHSMRSSGGQLGIQTTQTL